MFKVMGGVRSVSCVQGDGRGQGASAMYKVMGGGLGASAMYKVIGGGEGRQPCSR